MRFVCDNCHAQYMISDEKVGSAGVRVRCKKCSHIITVRRPAEEEPRAESFERDATEVMMNPLGASPPPPPPEASGPSTLETPAVSAETAAPPPVADSAPTAMVASGPFSQAELEDEIGQAFDSVLGGRDNPGAPVAPDGSVTDPSVPVPAAAASPSGALLKDDDDPDRLATRVMDLAQYASLTKAGASDLVSAASKGNGADEAQSSEWYVAINDQQVGPMDLAGVRAKWDTGELTPDSLVWRPGLADWKPLSTVSELAQVVAPVPKHAPAGATAAGAQLPWKGGKANGENDLAAGPPSAPPLALSESRDETEWKPQAASALASLVEEEIAALTKPTPKRGPEPVGVGEEPPAKKGMLDIPESPGERSSVERRPSERGRPSSRVLDAEISISGTGPAQRPSSPRERAEGSDARARSSRRTSEPEYSIPWRRDRTPRALLYVVGGGFAAFITVVAVILVVFLRPTPQGPPPLPAVSAPVAPHPVATPAPTPPPAKPGEAAAQTGTPATPTPTTALPATQPVAPKAVADAPRKPEPKGATPGTSRPPGTRVAVKAPPEKDKPQPKDEPQPTRGRDSKVDDDFDKLFGTGGESKGAREPAEEDKPSAAKKKPSYIPPAVGMPEKQSLSQSDIMQVVLSNKPAIAVCVQQHKAKNPSDQGTVVMKWTIRGDGKTTGVKCETDEFAGSVLEKCLAQSIKSWQFPTFSGPSQTVPFPFKF